jgi:L-ascorbate metabolism protein UlaG (beta-lactamase superfamily)
MKALSRRSFIAGAAAAAGLGWLHDSSGLIARTVRGAMADYQRDALPAPSADLSGWTNRTLDVLWVGHATVLLNFFGLHILTDPVLLDWVGVRTGLATIGRKRLVRSALDPERLPRIDLVLLSHAHMDHLDFPSLCRVNRSARIVTAPATGDLVARLGFAGVNELRWGETLAVSSCAGSVRLTGVEVKHWGARWKYDSHRGYLGFMLEREGRRILFGGDTGDTEAFEKIKGRPIDLAIMPIGSYGSGSGNHCTPEQTVRMVDEMGADRVVPIHHSTFPIGREPLSEPLERFEGALKGDRIALRLPGESWRLPA